MIKTPRCVGLLMAMMWTTMTGFSQQPDNGLGWNLFRMQLVSLARMVADSAGVVRGSSMVLAVDAAERKTAVENVFLGLLQERGARVSLPESGLEPKNPLLRISDVRFGMVRQDSSRKGGGPTYRTELDARVEDQSTAQIRYLGHFVQEGRDAGAGLPAESESILGRILEPLVVIAGTVLIVYLFFTVRS